MQMFCEACGESLEAKHVNLIEGVVKCPQCRVLRAIEEREGSFYPRQPEVQEIGVSEQGDQTVVEGVFRFHPEGRPWMLMAAMLLVTLGLLWGVIEAFDLTLQDNSLPALLVVMIPAVLGLTYSGIALGFQRIILTLTPDALEVSHGPFPWPGRGKRALPRGQLQGLFVRETRSKLNPEQSAYELFVRGEEGETTLLGPGSLREELLCFASHLQQPLGLTSQRPPSQELAESGTRAPKKPRDPLEQGPVSVERKASFYGWIAAIGGFSVFLGLVLPLTSGLGAQGAAVGVAVALLLTLASGRWLAAMCPKQIAATAKGLQCDGETLPWERISIETPGEEQDPTDPSFGLLLQGERKRKGSRRLAISSNLYPGCEELRAAIEAQLQQEREEFREEQEAPEEVSEEAPSGRLLAHLDGQSRPRALPSQLKVDLSMQALSKVMVFSGTLLIPVLLAAATFLFHTTGKDLLEGRVALSSQGPWQELPGHVSGPAAQKIPAGGAVRYVYQGPDGVLYQGISYAPKAMRLQVGQKIPVQVRAHAPGLSRLKGFDALPWKDPGFFWFFLVGVPVSFVLLLLSVLMPFLRGPKKWRLLQEGDVVQGTQIEAVMATAEGSLTTERVRIRFQLDGQPQREIQRAAFHRIERPVVFCDPRHPDEACVESELPGTLDVERGKLHYRRGWKAWLMPGALVGVCVLLLLSMPVMMLFLPKSPSLRGKVAKGSSLRLAAAGWKRAGKPQGPWYKRSWNPLPHKGPLGYRGKYSPAAPAFCKDICLSLPRCRSFIYRAARRSARRGSCSFYWAIPRFPKQPARDPGGRTFYVKGTPPATPAVAPRARKRSQPRARKRPAARRKSPVARRKSPVAQRRKPAPR